MIKSFCIYSPKTSIVSLLLASVAWIPVQASVIAVDGDVPSSMNAGGTAVDPAEYIIGNTGAYSSYLPFIYAGDTTSYNQLIIRNGSSIQGGIVGYIGNGAASNNNSVTVSGNDSEWSMTASLLVGYSGSRNSLVIENGGKVSSSTDGSSSGFGSIGYNSSSSNNSVTIRGLGSNWTSLSGVTVGAEGSSNSMRIESGGSLNAGYLAVGQGNSNFSGQGDNNSLVVTGSGSTVTTTQTTSVGYFSSGNSLTVENGASLTAYGLQVGLGNDSAPSNDNTVKVTGPGSTITVTTGQISIGGTGTGNSFTIENGAVVVVQEATTPNNVGRGSGTSGNSMLVSGAGSSFTGSLNVGNESAGNSLTIENGATVNSDSATIGYFTTEGNSVVVKGSNSSWNIANQLQIGQVGADNSMTIEDGASVTTGSALVGYSRNGNFVEVSGENSVWRNEGNLTLGQFSSNNTLTIRDSAIVVVEGNFVVSEYSGSDNFLRLDGGFFAWEGDRASDMLSLLNNNVIQFWDGAAWASAVGGEATYTFFATDEEAFAATGYEGLGGYTVMTSVPEPGTWALLGGTALVALVVYRRRMVLRR